MNVKDLEKLLASVAEADLNEFTLETGEYKLSLKRGVAETQVISQPVIMQAATPTVIPEVNQTAAPASQEITPATAVEPQAAPAEPELASNLVDVTAPIVGTFYAASAPDTPDYVKLGDKVTAGTVLCIIEAMKLMNEIEAEVSGTIAEILVKNEDPVEYGQVLFRIDPS